MKTFIAAIVPIIGVMALCSCTTVKEREPSSHTSTTTESTSVQQPVTTETQTVRSY